MDQETTQKSVIVLDEKYAITVQPIDYALAKISTDKSGKRSLKPIAYYGTIGKCLQEYVKQAVHSELSVESDISLQEAQKAVETAISRCIRVIEQKFPEYVVRKTKPREPEKRNHGNAY